MYFFIIIIFCLFNCSFFNTSQSSKKYITPTLKNHNIPLPKLNDNLSKKEKEIITKTFFYIFFLEKKSLCIPFKTYKQKSVFEKYFGFPFDGFQLGIWIKNRINSIQKGDTGFYTATIHNKHLVLGDAFFQLSVLDRTVILIHEAKHSEGSQYSHVRCPYNFGFLSPRNLEANLENTLSCDNRPDGAYGVTTSFLFEMIAYNLGNKELLVGKYNSEMARIITKPSCFLF